jgi:Tol biopolymer transport system component
MESLENREMLSVASVSLRVDGADTGNTGATFSQQSADGRYVVFRSASTNLVSGVNDVNGFNSDIFRRDRLTGKTELVSVSRSAPNQTPNAPSFNAYISANGRYVVFESDATDLVANDTNFRNTFNPGRDVFVRDMVTKTTILVSVNLQGNTTMDADNLIRESDQTDGRLISDNGRYVVFQSQASDLAAGDTNGHRDVFVRDITGATTYLVNVNNAGQAGQGPSDHGVISADGRYIAFESHARNLIPNDFNFNPKIFLHDLQTRTTTLVSNNDLQSGSLSSGGSFLPKISADGNVIVFESFRRLSAADANNANRDVYVRDMRKAIPDLVSISYAGGPANSTSFSPNISDDGKFVVFESLASNLTTTDKDPSTPDALVDLDHKDVFRRDLTAGKTVLVSFNFGGTQSALGESRNIHVSGDGRIVAWESQSRNLTSGFVERNDQVFDFDIFRRDMTTGKTRLVSGRLGSLTQSSNDGAVFPVVSRDGRYVTFHSTSDDLIAVDTNSGNGGRQTDVFVSGAVYKTPPSGSSGNDVFVLTYTGVEPTGSVAITRSINGAAATSLGSFSLEAPLTLSGLGGADSVRIVGTTGKDVFTVSGTGLLINGAPLVLSSIENRTMVGRGGDDAYIFDADSPLGTFTLDESGGGLDTINLSPTTTRAVVVNLASSAVQVVNSHLSLNLLSASTFENAVGGSGNDILLGNALNNSLTGRDGSDILVGNAGADSLSGGNGRDILIGGLGLDKLLGEGDDDILIAGRTTSDSIIGALTTIRTAWTSASAYGTRVAQLRAGVGSPSVSLKATVNVLNDAGDDDLLTGGTGADWYFLAVDDIISDLAGGEIKDVL